MVGCQLGNEDGVLNGRRKATKELLMTSELRPASEMGGSIIRVGELESNGRAVSQAESGSHLLGLFSLGVTPHSNLWHSCLCPTLLNNSVINTAACVHIGVKQPRSSPECRVAYLSTKSSRWYQRAFFIICASVPNSPFFSKHPQTTTFSSLQHQLPSFIDR